MDTVWLGEVEYREALDLQFNYMEQREEGKVPNTLLLLTHPHVYTLGRSGDETNLLVPKESLASEGIFLERTGRGGDITYHGPGQLMGYLIFQMKRPEVHRFVQSIEAALIDALAWFDIESRAVPGLTGVWVGDNKIASIGIGVRRRITYHGFALNVTTDLSRFQNIHMCGLKGREVTSIADLKGSAPPMEVVCARVSDAVARRLSWVS